MSIENITGKILAEAEEQGRHIMEEASNKSQQIIEEANQHAQKIREESREKSKENAQLIKSRKISVAELEVRKIRLGAKQAQISECFGKALDYLSNMEEDDYLELLASTIAKIGGNGGELILNSKDRDNLGEKLIRKVNDSGMVGELTLADETISAKGGFVLRRGSVEINSTLETMVSSIRESATADVVRALYG